MRGIYTKTLFSKIVLAASIIIALLLISSCIFGCSRQVKADITSPLTKIQAEALAASIAGVTGGMFCEIAGESDSMGIAISEHAFVVVLSDWHRVKTGDVVAVRMKGKLVLHSVVSTHDGYILTAGLNNDTGDDWIPRSDYIGTMIVQVYHE